MTKDNTSIRWTPEELEKLEEFKLALGIKGQHGEDNRAVKLALTIALNVVRNIFGNDHHIQITPPKRSRRKKKIFKNFKPI